jgi:hypothetical protein
MCETATLSALLWGYFGIASVGCVSSAKKHDCWGISEKSK